jgi:PTH1 family peptidyl-tRNA hydrolase
MAAEEFLARHRRGEAREEHGSIVAPARLGGEQMLVARPLSFMNRSGGPVAALCRTYRLIPTDLIVAYDDADLPLGVIRVRPAGRAAGHRGLESIVEALGSEEIPRVRLGIGRPAGSELELAEYVLEEFQTSEQEFVGDMIKNAADAVEMVLLRGVTAAMNTYNRRARERTEGP